MSDKRMAYSKKDINNFEQADAWPLIEAYFDNKHLSQLVRHQLESYNNFVTYPGFPSPIFNPFKVTDGIKQKGVEVTKASSAS